MEIFLLAKFSVSQYFARVCHLWHMKSTPNLYLTLNQAGDVKYRAGTTPGGDDMQPGAWCLPR